DSRPAVVVAEVVRRRGEPVAERRVVQETLDSLDEVPRLIGDVAHVVEPAGRRRENGDPGREADANGGAGRERLGLVVPEREHVRLGGEPGRSLGGRYELPDAPCGQALARVPPARVVLGGFGV